MEDLKHYPGMPEEYVNRKLTERVNAIENQALTTLSTKTSSFSITQQDNNSVATCTAGLTATVQAGLDQTSGFAMEIRAGVSATITVAAGNGVTLVLAGASVANTSVTVDGSSVLISGSGTADKFYLYKLGA